MRLFEDVFAPHLVPSLGGFSITTFSLSAFFQLFLKGRCWWSHSNTEWPYIRYTGCRLTFYRSDSSDYIIKYHRCPPMTPTLETYNATQPAIMQLGKHHKIITCKKHNNHKKPYKKLKLKPPATLQNKWYFQKDLATTPLLFLMASAASYDRYFLASNAQSTTTGFVGFNPDIFKYHHFTQQTTSGYHPKDGLYFWSVQQSTTPPTEISKIQIGNMIFLGNSQKYQVGSTINDVKNTVASTWEQKMQKYMQSFDYWGNMFIPYYLTGNGVLIVSTQHPSAILKTTNYSDATTTLKDTHFRFWNLNLLIKYRYNPFPDTGLGNKIYFIDLNDLSQSLDPPRDLSLQNNNLALWVGLWGLTDWQKLKKPGETIDTEKLLVIQTKFTHPKSEFIIPIDDDFLNGNSPFTPREISASDQLNWHPKTRFQYRTISKLCQTGPGTIKLPQNVSAEGHMNFMFYFKLGSCAQTTKDINNPETQPSFTYPGNLPSTNSLQSPETPLENYLYGFDWRRDFLTQKATDRIKKHSASAITSFTAPGINLFNPPAPPETSSEGETSDQEKEKEALQSLLKQLRLQQRQYKHRIIQLMGQLE